MASLAFFAYSLATLALLIGANRYVVRRTASVFGWSQRHRRLLSIALGLCLGTVVVCRVLAKLRPELTLAGLMMTAAIIQLAVVLSSMLYGLLDALERMTRRRQSSAEPTLEMAAAADQTETALPRRSFLMQAGTGGALLVASSSSIYGALHGRLDYQLEDVPIQIPGLSAAWDGLRIAQLSDIHIGPYVAEPELNAAFALLQRAKPDLIVLTGDLIDQDPRLAPRLGAFVRRLRSLARLGVYAVTGNHDFYAGVERVELALVAGGAVVLRNRGVVIGDRSGGIALLGVDDVYGERMGMGPDLARAVGSLPSLDGKVAPALDLPRVLLCHNPSYFKQAAGSVALQLSGHTHGGQITLPGDPLRLLLAGGWIAGRYQRGGSQLYVNRGFGTVGPPARLGAAPEVTSIILTT
jgi:uncharacterized protein